MQPNDFRRQRQRRIRRPAEPIHRHCDARRPTLGVQSLNHQAIGVGAARERHIGQRIRQAWNEQSDRDRLANAADQPSGAFASARLSCTATSARPENSTPSQSGSRRPRQDSPAIPAKSPVRSLLTVTSNVAIVVPISPSTRTSRAGRPIAVPSTRKRFAVLAGSALASHRRELQVDALKRPRLRRRARRIFDRRRRIFNLHLRRLIAEMRQRQQRACIPLAVGLPHQSQLARGERRFRQSAAGR